MRDGGSTAGNAQIKGASFGRNASFAGASKHSIARFTQISEREDTMERTKLETGKDSARIKKMFNDMDSDLPFYKKMSEVYKAAYAKKEEEEARQ